MSDSELASKLPPLPGQQSALRRLYRSCDTCRASKLRCRIESQASPPGACLRCSERRIHCSFSPVAARAKKSSTRRSTSRRLCDIEKRVQDLQQQLQRKAGDIRNSQTETPNSGPLTPLPSPSSSHPQLGKSVQQFAAHRSYMSETKIEQMFEIYLQDQTSFFPKCALSTDAEDHKQLQRNKPLLFLSVLVASASVMSGELAGYLGIELDNILKDSIYANHEQSIEILQALWNHVSHYFDPSYARHAEIIQYVKTGYEMAISLANGAGLLEVDPANGLILMQRHEIVDICRQILLWELARWLISVRTRHSLTPAHEGLIRQSQLILENSANYSDIQTVAWLKLARITKEAMVSLFLGYTTAPGLTDVARDSICAAFERELEIWLRSCPSSLQRDLLMIQYRTDMIIVCEFLLPPGHYSVESLRAQNTTLPSLERPTNHDLKYRFLTMYQLRFTKRCIRAVQGVLEIFTKIEPNRLKSMNTVVYGRAFHSLRFLLQIAHRIHINPAHCPITLETLRVQYYLNAMCCQLSAASDSSKHKVPALWLNALKTKILPWYQQLEYQAGKSAKAQSCTALQEMELEWRLESTPGAPTSPEMLHSEDITNKEAMCTFGTEHAQSSTPVPASTLATSGLATREEQWWKAAANINMNDLNYLRTFFA